MLISAYVNLRFFLKKNGDSIPRGLVAEQFGLVPGIPLKEQGYPDGIGIEILNFPGVK